MDPYVKGVNTDKRSKKKLRFTSAKERSKRASADVYRSYKRQYGVTSAATREEFVHNPSLEERARKRSRSIKDEAKESSLVAKTDGNAELSGLDDEVNLQDSTTFAGELDIALDRNGSEIFAKFHRKVWGLVRSLPEILHHSEKIVDLLLNHLLSPASNPGEASDIDETFEGGFVANHATTDILHLLSVLARDLRHEIHPFLHSKIMPRFVDDLLNPPSPPPGSEKQAIPLSVTVIEAAFRTLSYIFRYDSEELLQDMEVLRTYYGKTLGHRRELVRRLAAEAFAPVVRKIKSDKSRNRHLKRVLRALLSTSSQHKTNAFLRAQSDAIDGIAELIFQVIKGTHGRMHSRGASTVVFVLEFVSDPQNSSQSDSEQRTPLSFRVLENVMEQLCGFIDPKHFLDLWKCLYPATKGVVDLFVGGNGDGSAGADSRFIVLQEMLIMVARILAHNDSKFVGSNFTSLFGDVFKLLATLATETTIEKIGIENQGMFLSTIYSVTKPFLESPSVDDLLKMLLPGILVLPRKTQPSVDALVTRSQVTARDILPALKSASARSIACEELLTAASSISHKNSKKALDIVFVVSTYAGASTEENDETAGDHIFSPRSGEEFGVKKNVKETLLKGSLLEIENFPLSESFLSEVVLSLRCIPFLAVLGRLSEDESSKSGHLIKSMGWIVNVLDCLHKAKPKDEDKVTQRRIVMSIALDSLSALSYASIDFIEKSSVVEKPIKRVKSLVENLLTTYPDSVWVVKAASAYNKILNKLAKPAIFKDRSEDLFELLVPNLRSSSHFLRLHSLEILASHPKKPFVTDHADLDLSEDLDEEPSFNLAGGQSSSFSSSGLTGLCDIIDTLLKLEQAEVRLQNERALLSLISRVEVLGRTGKLPVLYAEAATNHMMGTFYVKFSPMWDAATRAIVALATGHEDAVWPAIETKLVEVVTRHPDRRRSKEENEDLCNPKGLDHYGECIRWEETAGNFFQLSRVRHKEDGAGGYVSKRLTTDGESVMESVWKVAEHAPHLVSRHSRVIVPVFIGFLHEQYYKYHSNDPDSKELNLGEHVTEKRSYDISLFDKYSLQKRLAVFLRAFGSITGPQQLVKHKLLEMIFISFLNHQDVQIVQLAFSCLMRYKPAYLVPYSEFLKTVLRKGGLREGLLNFGEKIKEDPINSDYYNDLVPVVSRILFGRLIAKGIEKKSSKDSPASRRAAILSFLSMLCRDENDLFPFFYLMSRSFLSTDFPLKPMESLQAEEKEKVLEALSSVGNIDLASIRGPVFEGILNLMEAVVSQLGVRAAPFALQMTSITLAMMKYVEVRKPSVKSDSDSEDEPPIDADIRNIRFGQVRTLSFRRLSDIFGAYAARVDFQRYTQDLWDPLEQSLKMLPEMAKNSEGAPALLVLLQTLSTHSKLIELLERKEEAISSVIECISSSSSTAVIVVCLTFINNILDEKKFPEDLIPLLLTQFTDRLEKSSEPQVKPKSSLIKTKVESTKRRELDILCRVSDLVRSRGDEGLDMDSITVERLCNLLVSFIQPGQMAQDADKLNILEILESLVPSTSSEAKDNIFVKGSQLLAPYKAKPINSTIQIRLAISTLLSTVSKGEPRYERVVRKVQNLSAVHPKRIDEKDFDLVIPELTALGGDAGGAEWLSLCLVSKNRHEPSLLVPVINACYHFLFDDDGVISRAAYNALAKLLKLTGEKVLGAEGNAKDTDDDAEAWLKLAESAIIPLARSGLHCVDASTRRRFIMLISESSRAFHSHPSHHLYGDLFHLIRDDNPDLDFFLGMTHVQLHRRARALQRLRKVLNESAEEGLTVTFSAQSMSNILLVLAQHPIYECRTKAEEPFATEAIATVGAISRILSWSKYNNLLWTALNQFERHTEQERFLIGMICAVIDGFHFDVDLGKDEGTPETNIKPRGQLEGNSVWRALENRIIPKLEGLLTKEKTDKGGNKIKLIRPTVALAMLKLFKKFPKVYFETRLHRLLAVLCDSLRNRDSDARDIARSTMAKMVVSMDIRYLGDVIRELAITLNEGYKLHVRSAVLHTILMELLETYKPISIHSDGEMPPFDHCVAGMMDLIQEDLFGEAQERKESRDTQVRYVKEAGGSKGVHAVEMICRLILFKPSHSATSGQMSSIHYIVSPLLERLRLPDTDASVIRKIQEILTRVVVGLSHNPSVTFEELLPFVYASVQPFVGDEAIATVTSQAGVVEDDDVEDGSDLKAITISGSGKSSEFKDKKRHKGKVIEWRPSTLKTSKNMKDVRAGKAKDKKDLRTVHDGASAPKLTGSSRYATISASSSRSLNDPSTISAVVFGLNLLNACLKKMALTNLDDFEARLDPFLPLLTACVCHCRDNQVALTSLKCLMPFFKFPLPSMSKCANALGSQTLKLLTSTGSSNKNHDMTQACFKTLTYLIGLDSQHDNGAVEEITENDMVDGLGESVLSKGATLPLDSDQMEVLISLLQISVVESEQHNPALALIKAIMSRKYVSPEFYDLMETMIKLTVRSQKQSLRQQCSGIFLRYLLDYPIGDDRVDKHLKQIISNINYEYQEGRISALNLVCMVVEKLPEEVLEKYAQGFFLPLVLQLANDDSSDCRTEVSRSLQVLLKRCPTELLKSLYSFSSKWSKESGPLRTTSLQLFGIFAEARPDFFERRKVLEELLDHLLSILDKETNADWETIYFTLICCEKLSGSFSKAFWSDERILPAIVHHLIHSHPWIKLCTGRLVNQYLNSIDLAKFLKSPSKTNYAIVRQPGMLFQIIRNVCIQLNRDEEEQNNDLAVVAIKSLSWALPVMKLHPQLCFSEEYQEDNEKGRDPVLWLLTRLSNIAKPKGMKRREAVFKCFAAFVSLHTDIMKPHLELLLEPLHRADIEATNEIENPSVLHKQHLVSEEATSQATIARDLLQLLEETYGDSQEFLTAFASVKTKAREKREERKMKDKLEAVRDPENYAKLKSEKHLRDRKRKKRRVEEKRQSRGATAKRRHVD